MKKLDFLISSILFGCYSASASAYLLPKPIYFYYEKNHIPRLLVTGFAGASPLARGDLLFPFNFTNNSLFFGDIQGEYGEDNTAYIGGGLAYRRILNPCNILGGYLFLDDNTSKHQNHYQVLSPGVEYLGGLWDARLNGYFPVSRKTKEKAPFVLGGLNGCGINDVDCEFNIFQGHQQFARQFANLEQVGPGLDGEVGFIVPHARGLRLHAGGYYFHLEDFKDVKGIEGRVEFPLNRQIMLTAESSYDNQQRGRVVAGLQFAIGGAYADPRSIYSRLEDPIMRNLGTVGRGNGIPILSRRKEKDRILVRDNIFFFSPTGSAISGSNAGTFENPFAPDQFSQVTVDNVFLTTGNGNFYFASGTYTIAGPDAPNEVVTLHDTQGLFGRSADFKCSAVGTERPTLLGGLVFEGHNTLDSIQLINNLIHTGNGRVVAVDMVDAPDNHICNSLVAANAVIEADIANISNIAIGIHANNSSATIDTSDVQANAIMLGSGFNVMNAAVAIGAVGGNAGQGGIGGNAENATFTVTGGTGLDGTGEQGEAGLSESIDETTLGGIDGADSSVLDTFSGNIFNITTSAIMGSATVAGSLNTSLNAGMAIGAIAGRGGLGGFAGDGGTLGVTVTSGAGGDGVLAGGIGGIGGNASATLLGGNGGTGGDATATANFENNNFSILDTQILGEAIVQNVLFNFSANIAVGMGAIGGIGGTGGFGGDGGNIDPIVISVSSAGAGTLGGIGGRSGEASATVTAGNGGQGGLASTFATFANNFLTVTRTSIDVVAHTGDINNSFNSATGMGAVGGLGGIGVSGGTGGSIDVTINSGQGGDGVGEDSQGGQGGNATANLVGGSAGGGGSSESEADFNDNRINITGSIFNVDATVINGVTDFFSINSAIGIGAIGGLSGVGGNGGSSGDLTNSGTAGSGGEGAAGGIGGNGGLLNYSARAGEGGSGGQGSLEADFMNNTLSLTATPISVVATVNSLMNSSNIAIGFGTFGGAVGVGGSGGDGATLSSTVTAGNGGTGLSGTGGHGGDTLVTLSLDPTGQGGDAATLNLFQGNTVIFNNVQLTVLANAAGTAGNFGSTNAAVAIGAIGGKGGIGGNGGDPAVVINNVINGISGLGPNGGAGGIANVQVLPPLIANGGDARSEVDFVDNNLAITNSSLIARATLINNLDVGFNSSVLIGGFAGFPGVDGLSPINGGLGGSGEVIADISGNTINITSLTGQSQATVANTISQSVNEAIGFGTDTLLGVNSTFETNQINSTGSDLSVFATVTGNNGLTDTNKALGLFAGNGTVINYFNGNLTVLAQVLGVNLGNNITAPTETAGTGVINF
jgi:hypothetical protein